MRRSLLLLVPLLLVCLAPSAARAQNAITEITVIFGDSSGIQPPAGYEKYGVDLNQGAGGDYIYLCFKRGVGAPVTGVDISLSRDPIPASAAPAGWTQVPVDLNRNAGGFFVYVYYTKDPACSTVRDVVVLQGSQAAPAGYTAIELDLNRGTDGDVLFLAYKAE